MSSTWSKHHTVYEKISTFIVCFQDKVFPYPKPTDDLHETLQMMIDSVLRFFAKKGRKFF